MLSQPVLLLQKVAAGEKLIQLYLNCIHYLLYVSLMLLSCATLYVASLYPLDTDCDLGHALLGGYPRATKLGKTMAPVLQPPFLSGGLWVDISCYEGRKQWWL